MFGQVEWEFNECYAFIHTPPHVKDFGPTDYGQSLSHEAVAALSCWCNRLPRISAMHAQTLTVTPISWNLSPDVSMADHFNHQLKFCLAAIDARKGMGCMQGFKVGITHKPFERWGGHVVQKNCS